jgi:prepilin peptidase CpaA
MLTMLTSLIAIGIAIVAFVFDVRTRRIPNALTFSAALAGLIFHVASSGQAGSQLAGGGWVVGLLMLLPFFLLGGMGGGDIKLVAALGAWLGPSQTFWLAIYAGLAGGVMGVIVAASHGYLRTAIANVSAMFGYWSTVGIKSVPGLTLESSASPRLAYAIPVLVGTLVTIWL